VVIIPSGGGVFEVDLDQQRVFSKKELGRHAEPDEILKALRAAIQ
jgi:selenoprotein W-related protein